MTIINDYFEYTKKYTAIYGDKTLVLIQVGSFFECYALENEDGTYYGSCIKEFANINDMIIAKKNICVGNNKVLMAGFGVHVLDKYLKKMLDHNYTVVVYVQDNQAKNTTRSLDCIYSPGTYFNSNESDSNKLSNNICSIWLELCNNKMYSEPKIIIGISIIDILTGKLVNYQYDYLYINSPSVYDELEKYMCIYNPCEILFVTNNIEKNYISNLINYSNIKCKKYHEIVLNNSVQNPNKELENVGYKCEKQNYQEHIIDKIYGIGSFKEKQEFYEYNIATQSLCFLFDFVEKHNPNLIKNIDYPIFENLNDKLILANHSLNQLNIINNNNDYGKLSSVQNFLNNSITNAGKRQFNYDLLHPICNIETLQESYDIIESMCKTKIYNNIRDILPLVKDIEKIKRKLELKKIQPNDFVHLHDTLEIVNNLYNFLKKNEKKNKLLINYINTHISSDITPLCTKIKNFINDKFIIEKCTNCFIEKLNSYEIENLNFLNTENNKNLYECYKTCIDSRQQLECITNFLNKLLFIKENPKKINEYNNSTNYIKIHETSKNDIMLLITSRRYFMLKDILKNYDDDYTIEYISNYTNKKEFLNFNVYNIIHKEHGNNKTNVILTSPQILQITSNIHNAKDILISNINSNYFKIVEEFINFTNENKLNIINKFVSVIDVFHAKAYNCAKYNYTKPIIKNNDNKSYFKFKKMRHLLIEHINNNELYVTNDLELGTSDNGLLLYGTNAVGKTSFIKSVGISIILAQAGMFVPCDEFIFYPYNFLFTRLLGNDNIFKGLSTFAVEMCELRTILKYSTENSIILGDELCSGTESTSALSIFVASLEQLYKYNSTFLFATHFHEILNYQEIKNLTKMKIMHMTVIFDATNNKLLYDRKLIYGPGEAMYGLEVCKSLNLPNEFIERSYQIRNKYCLIEHKKTRYNSKKFKDICEICKLNNGQEIHHLQFQKNANNNGIINNEFSKNHKANLINICNNCHDKIHDNNIQYKKIKTSDGFELLEL